MKPHTITAALAATAILLTPLTTADTARAADGACFRIVVVPDTQYATELYPGILDDQISWILQSNVRTPYSMVLQEGDIVENRDESVEWDTAHAAWSRLDGVIPVMFAAGNHDEQDYSMPDKEAPEFYDSVRTNFDTFVSGFDHYTVDGQYPEGSYANSYRLFDINGGKYMVLTVEYGATDDVLAWARGVVAANSDRYVILLTHDYLGQNNKIRGAPGHAWEIGLPSKTNPALNDPWQTWAQLVRVSPNIKLVFSGHVTTKTIGYDYSVGRLKSTNDAGRYVYQMLANYQRFDSGGDGVLRVVKVCPADRTVAVRTYSTSAGEWFVTPADEFLYTGVNLAPLG